MVDLALWLVGVRNELVLFATFGFALGGLDDLVVDFLWLSRLGAARLDRKLMAFTSVTDLPPPDAPGKIAVFVPAWQEQGVIADMLRHALHAWAGKSFDIYVGCYPNDFGTIEAVLSLVDRRVRLAMVDHEGPTTKADCLNAIYAAMSWQELWSGKPYKAVLLHDAEDLVHPDELTVCDTLIEKFILLQLPVLPLQTKGSPWVSGHYLDEFAEAHNRDMVVRGSLGVAIPSAGVGCSLRRSALKAMERADGGKPFSDDSLTEDYELGLRLAETGAPMAFVRIGSSSSNDLVATRAHFPDTLPAAVRQKARWIIGIALAGWDRMGWRSGWGENWMRLRDRRSPFAALVTLCGYGALLLTAVLMLIAPHRALHDRPENALFVLTGALVVWRLFIRSMCVFQCYGWKAAAVSIPRTITSNIIAVLAARRAIVLYAQMRRTGEVNWDKTAHRSPLVP